MAGERWHLYILYTVRDSFFFQFKTEIIDFKDDPNVIAVANFTNDQHGSGWMYLEIKTREDANDKMQAKAAGIAEGYLTRSAFPSFALVFTKSFTLLFALRTYIIESYKEFYANDICTSDPKACAWLKAQIKENTKYVAESLAKYADTDPFWHQVGLMYTQIEGIAQGTNENEANPKRWTDLIWGNVGYKTRSLQFGLSDEGMDDEIGVHLLTLIAEFWDLKEQYVLLNLNKATRLVNPSRPSCSVLIKHVADREDIIFAHNTWHEYRAMAYRWHVVKTYMKLNPRKACASIF